MSEVISYRLTGDWRHIVEDGLVDLDDLPDEALPTGHVEFIPLAPKVAVSGSPETAYTVSSFKALIAAGVLTDLQGREGVQIAGWVGDTPVYWRAVTHLEYMGRKIPYPDVEFTLEGDSRLTGIVASGAPGESATIYHPRIEALIDELDNKSDVGHVHQITDVEGLMQALEDASYSGGGGEGGEGGPVSWTQVRNKPTTFPPSSHTHPLGDVNGLQAALDAKVGNTDPRLSDARDPKAHTHSWASLTGKPGTFPPEGHGHTISDISGLQQALEDAANSGTGGGGGDGSPVTWISILNKPSEFPPEAHTHLIRDVNGLQGALDAKVGDTDPRLTDARTPKSHTHYWSEVTGKPLSYPPATHTHQIGDTTGLQGALDSKVGNSDPRLSDARTPTAHTHVWDEVTEKPSVFPPEVHGHSISQVTGLQGALDGKSATGHGHSINDVDGLQAALDAATGGSGSSVNSVYFYGAPYTHTHLIPNPVDGDVFVDSNMFVSSFTEGSWQLIGGFHPENIEEYQLTDGAVSKAKLSQDVQDEIDGKADAAHTHTIGDVVNLRDELDGKSNAGHTHSIDDVNGLQGELDDKADSAHSHVIAGVTGLQAALDAKAETGHGHEIADVNGLQAALDAAAESGGDDGSDGPRVYVQGYPYGNTTEVPNPKVGDVFWRAGIGALSFYNDSGLWYGTSVIPGGSTVTTGTINDGAVTRVKLASDVRTELDGLRTDLDAVDITAESLGAIERAGSATTVWSGTQAEYDALPESTRHAVGFIGVIV